MLLGVRMRQFFSLSSSFTVLGLKSTSRMEEVKKKYLELAKQYHPDFNQNDAAAHLKFTEITRAYRLILESQASPFLSKPTSAASPSSHKAHRPPFTNHKRQRPPREQDHFEDFKAYDNFFRNPNKFRKPKAGEDIHLTLAITIQEAILGVKKQLIYTKYEPCPACSLHQFTACFSCGGKGKVYERVGREKVHCEYCSGKGFRNDCSECMGGGYLLKKVREQVFVERGTKDKSILRLEKKGHSGYKANNGDVYVTVLVEQNQKFRIDGNNVHSEESIPFWVAVCGGTVEVETVHGLREVRVRGGTQSGEEIRLFNGGLQSPYSKRLGDHVVKVRIGIPSSMSEKDKRLFEQLSEQ